MADRTILERKIARIVVRVAFGATAALLLAYPADWAIWRLRVAMGGGMGTVSTTDFTVAELKGNKEDYYIDGTQTVDCSESLFPEAGSGACWWVRRHPDVLTKY